MTSEPFPNHKKRREEYFLYGREVWMKIFLKIQRDLRILNVPRSATAPGDQRVAVLE